MSTVDIFLQLYSSYTQHLSYSSAVQEIFLTIGEWSPKNA